LAFYFTNATTNKHNILEVILQQKIADFQESFTNFYEQQKNLTALLVSISKLLFARYYNENSHVTPDNSQQMPLKRHLL